MQNKIINTNYADYLESGNYVTDFKFSAQDTNFKTGIKAIDDIQDFYTGLYVIGSMPSMGKTTLALQIADNVAKSGRHVLYYSMQESICELFSKSISRTLFEICCEKGFSAYDFKKNPKAPSCYSSLAVRTSHLDDEEVKVAIEKYKESVGDRVSICFSHVGLTAKNIYLSVLEWMKEHPEAPKPLIVIDYLQGLDSSSETEVKKLQNAMHIFKSLQIATDITVLVLSAILPSHYMSPIDFSSFSKNDGIDDSADVIWGLQLNVVQKTDVKAEQKHILFRQELQDSFRNLDLFCIKNRFGTSPHNIKLGYLPEFNAFYSVKNDEPRDNQLMLSNLLSKYGFVEEES